MKNIISILLITLFLLTPSFGVAELTSVPERSSRLLSPLDFFEPIDDHSFFHSNKSEEIFPPPSEYRQVRKTISLSLDDVMLTSTNQNNTYLQLSDSIPFNQPDLPLIPMKTMTIRLQKDVIISDVRYEKYTIQKCQIPLSFPTTPLPMYWSLEKTTMYNHTLEIVQQTISTYENNPIYPGYTHSYIIGKNTTNTSVIIYLFPIQYDKDTQKTYVLTDGEIIIDYYLNHQPDNPDSLVDNNVENIIITPLRFINQAKKLQQFHEGRGTSTAVVTTTWIQTHFFPSDYPPVQGYKDFSLQDRIPKYEDKLARKIISFLQSQETNTHLKFVTIFGNARYVPPSYYFGEGYYPVPTDFYYASPDLDLIPNYCVGRIPINTIFEANRVVEKIINWDPTIEQMDHVAIAGGIPFSTPFYIGEMITLDSVNNGYLDGLSIDKYFKSDERFDSDDILSALEDDYGMLYMICHGGPFLIAVEEGRINVNTINRMAKNTNAPILSCIACSSGSYDTHVINQGRRLDKTSFGESIVLSKGGAIAYIGGSRTNDGYPLFDLVNGHVVTTKETYMAGLLTSVNHAYQSNVGYLGELTCFASQEYLLENDMTDFWNLYHYFSFVLLGDPALSLPSRLHSQPFYDQPITGLDEPIDYIDYISNDGAYTGTIPMYAIDETITSVCITDAQEIDVKYINTGDYLEIDEDVNLLMNLENVSFYDTYIAPGELLLLRFEIEDGKEDWRYLKPIRPVDDDFNEATDGFQETRWNHIQDAVDQSDPYDPIYVFNGSYKESLLIDKPIYITGENQTQTVIDGRGHNDVVAIFSDGVLLTDLTIEHCGRNPWNAAVRIQPDTSWNPSPITINHCRIQNNLNYGVSIDVSSKIKSPLINLTGNTVQYNHIGVYINPGPNIKRFYSNTFFGNTYGFYAVESQHDILLWNLFENNGVGMYLNMVHNIDVESNGFIDNDQHCQFLDIKRTTFDGNYWDNWIGNLFKRDLRIPKIINGIHDPNEFWLSQIRIDRHPSRYFIQNADFLKNYL
jgi:hypothetical protein